MKLKDRSAPPSFMRMKNFQTIALLLLPFPQKKIPIICLRQITGIL